MILCVSSKARRRASSSGTSLLASLTARLVSDILRTGLLTVFGLQLERDAIFGAGVTGSSMILCASSSARRRTSSATKSGVSTRRLLVSLVPLPPLDSLGPVLLTTFGLRQPERDASLRVGVGVIGSLSFGTCDVSVE